MPVTGIPVVDPTDRDAPTLACYSWPVEFHFSVWGLRPRASVVEQTFRSPEAAAVPGNEASTSLIEATDLEIAAFLGENPEFWTLCQTLGDRLIHRAKGGSIQTAPGLPPWAAPPADPEPEPPPGD